MSTSQSSDLMNMLPHVGKENACECDSIKDLRMERLIWVISWFCCCNHKCPYKRVAEGDTTTEEGKVMP